MSNTRKPRQRRSAAAAEQPPEPKPDIHALLGEARRAEKLVPVCLRGDLRAEWDALRSQLEQLTAQATTGRLTDGAPRRRIAEQMATVEQQMRAATVDLRFRALPHRRWRELLAEHPPRTGENGETLKQDAMGVNSDTFFETLIRECVVEPELDDDQWQQLLEEQLTDRQYDDLTGAAWSVNRSEVDVPFSRAASRILSSGTESKRPNDSESA